MRGFARRCEGVCSGARVRMHKSSAQNVCTVKFREGCRTSNGQRKQGPTSTGTGVVGAPTRIPQCIGRRYYRKALLMCTATAPSFTRR